MRLRAAELGVDRIAFHAEANMTAGPAPRRVAVALALLALDAILAVGLGWPAWADPGAVTIGARQDAPYTVWALAWVARAVGAGHSPFVTTHLSWPGGVNLLTNATATGLGVVLAPLTIRWGPLVSFNVAITASLALTAWSTQLVVRRGLGVSWPAATVAGVIAGFGPTALAQAGGAHVHVIAGFLVPPLLLGVARLASGHPAGPWRWGVAVGLLAAAQLLIGEELLAIAGLSVLIGLAIGSRRVQWRSLVIGAAVAAVVFDVPAAWPLWVQFAGRAHIVGAIQHGDRYADDLSAFVVPIHQVWLGSAWAVGVQRHFSSEGGAYLGAPLVAACVVVVVRHRRDRRLRVVGGAALVVAVLSLGSRLHVWGHGTGIALPWVAFAHLPLLESLLPVRFGVMLDLAAGALLAVGLDDLARRRVWPRPRRRQRHSRSDAGDGAWPPGVVAAVLLGVVCVIPLVPRLPFRTTRWTTPSFFRGHGAAAVPDDSLVVISPYPSEADPPVEVWLAEAGDRWRSAGGTYFVPGPTGRVTIGGPVPVADAVDVRLEQGESATALAPLRDQVLADLGSRGVGAVIAGPGPHSAEVVRWWTSLLGPPRRIGGVALWRRGMRSAELSA